MRVILCIQGKGDMEISYHVNDKKLNAKEFVIMAGKVWSRNYDKKKTAAALKKTLNITARNGKELVGCVRILTDGAYFGTVTEILVVPEFQNMGIGTQLMRLVEKHTPTKLYFGAQPQAEKFYEKLGYENGFASFVIKPKI